MPRRATVLALTAWLLFAAGATAAPSLGPLRVFAAASLTDPFQEIATLFEKSPRGGSVQLSFGGSQMLRVQIEQGAPADVYASADLENATALERAGFLEPSRIFAHNGIAVAVPAAGSRVRAVCDLARTGIRIIIADPAVPAGSYTRQVWTKLAAARLCGPDLVRHLQENVLTQETNARAVLSKVVLGEADAGFVYRTDVIGSSSVRALEIPSGCNVDVAYPIAIVAESPSRPAADAFIEMVLGPQGQAVLARHGFAR